MNSGRCRDSGTHSRQRGSTVALTLQLPGAQGCIILSPPPSWHLGDQGECQVAEREECGPEACAPFYSLLQACASGSLQVTCLQGEERHPALPWRAPPSDMTHSSVKPVPASLTSFFSTFPLGVSEGKGPSKCFQGFSSPGRGD